MLVTLEELKQNLRIETADDDKLLSSLLDSATRIVKDILRDEINDENMSVVRIGILYAATYMYEHREEADHNKMNLTLRALLFGERSSEF